MTNTTQPADLSAHAAEDAKSHGGRDLVLLCLAFFFIFLGPGATQQFLIPFMAKASARSHPQCSWILAGVYLSGLVWALLCGYTVRWIGARWSIVLGLLCYAGFSGCVYLWPSFWFVLAASLAWGWGAAAVWVSGPTRILENESPLRRGRASGIFFSAVFLGQALGVIGLGAIGEPRVIFGVAALIGLVGVACAWFVRAEETEIAMFHPTDTIAIMSDTRGKILCGLVFTSAMGFGMVLSPLGNAVQVKLGFGMIAKLTIWFYVGRLLIGWIAGWLTDKWGRIPVLAVAFFLGALGLGIAASSTSALALSAATLTLGIQAGMFHVPTTALVGDWIAPERRHLAFGALYAWKNLGISFAILGGERLRSAMGGDRVAFGSFAGIMVVCGVLTIIAGRVGEQTD